MKKNPKTKPVYESQQEAGEYLASFQRVSADFENYKKFVEENRATWRVQAKLDFVLKILPVLDNLRRAKDHLPHELADNDWVKGIIQIETQFENILAEEGLQKIQTKDQLFNHELHEAIAYEPDPKIAKDYIINEIEAGYLLGDKVVKHAKVRVSAGQK